VTVACRGVEVVQDQSLVDGAPTFRARSGTAQAAGVEWLDGDGLREHR
jgi:hypothetical protein